MIVRVLGGSLTYPISVTDKTGAGLDEAEKVEDPNNDDDDDDDGEVTSDNETSNGKLDKTEEDGRQKSKKAHKKGRDGSSHRKRYVTKQ